MPYVYFLSREEMEFQFNYICLAGMSIEGDDLAAFAAEGENVDESAPAHVIGRAGVRWSPGSVAGARRLHDVGFPTVTLTRIHSLSSLELGSNLRLPALVRKAFTSNQVSSACEQSMSISTIQ